MPTRRPAAKRARRDPAKKSSFPHYLSQIEEDRETVARVGMTLAHLQDDFGRRLTQTSLMKLEQVRAKLRDAARQMDNLLDLINPY